MRAAKVGMTCLHWSQPVVPHSSPCQTTLASAFSSPSSSSRKRDAKDRIIGCRFIRHSNSNPNFNFTSNPNRCCAFLGNRLGRSRSCDVAANSRGQTLRRACSASLEDGFSSSSSSNDEDFAKRLQELALRFHLSADDADTNAKMGHEQGIDGEFASALDSDFPSISRGSRAELPWSEGDEMIAAGVERKANSVDLPLSLRILKRKKQWDEGVREAGESACCSVKKAFSSMVFIIRELQSYTLHMREILFYEDLQGILVRVEKEMNASFVWLFQQIFSRTPTLMLYVMILLANFTVHSMSTTTAAAAAALPLASETWIVASEAETQRQPKFDPLSVKSFSVSGKSASVGGSGGGGGKVRPVAGATDGGDGRFEGSWNEHRTIFPDEMSRIGNPPAVEEQGVSGSEAEEKLWNSIVEEASRMNAGLRDVSLDGEAIQYLVSPITVELEHEDYTDYFRTELMYQRAVSEDPNNPLILSNYGQFLYLVVHDHDRAEEYFKRAVRIDPPDAESLGRYASFLWLARNDLTAAEETFLEAIAADPTNTFHAANYAHFLWNTGGEDTCYPLTE